MNKDKSIKVSFLNSTQSIFNGIIVLKESKNEFKDKELQEKHVSYLIRVIQKHTNVFSLPLYLAGLL